MARGTPDEEVYTPRVQPEDLPRKVVPRMEPVPVGQAFEQVAEASNRKYQADSATWAGDQITQARIKAVQDLETAKANAPEGDQTGFTQKYLADFDKSNQGLADSAGGNPIARQMVQKGLTDLRQTLQTHTMGWEAQQNVAYRADSLGNNLKAQLPIVEKHPELAQQVGATLNDQLQASGMEPAKRLPFMRLMDSQLSEAAATGLAKQNPDQTLHDLDDPKHPVFSHLDDKQRAQIKSVAQNTIATEYSDSIVNAYRAGGPNAGGRALGAVDKLDEPDEIKNTIRAEVEKGVSAWHEEAKQTHGDAIIGLESRLASGHPGAHDQGQVLDLYHAGVFSASQAGETIGRIEKAQEKQVDDDAWLKYTQAAYSNGQALDPKDKDIRAGIDQVFTTATKGVQPGSPEWINRAADIGQKTGVTPDSVISWSRTQLVGGDPATAAQAANAIQRVTDANPRGTPFALDDKDKAMARLINDAVTAGTDPKIAVENARKVTSLPDADLKRLDEVYKQKQLGSKSDGDLKSQLKADPTFKPHFWSGIPDVPPQMTGQFQQLRQNYFKLTNGDVDKANQLATADLKNTWGITAVNAAVNGGKKEFMPFAPESMNPGLTTEALRADLEASAKGHTDDPSKVRLLTTADTYQSNGQRWGLGVPDKFGAYSALTDEKGRVIPYQLPTATDAVKAMQAKASAEGMAKLHEQQAIERAREKNELGEITMQGRRLGF